MWSKNDVMVAVVFPELLQQFLKRALNGQDSQEYQQQQALNSIHVYIK